VLVKDLSAYCGKAFFLLSIICLLAKLALPAFLYLLLPQFTTKHFYMKHQQIIIAGKVENTGFRFYAFRGASMLGIRGFVLVNEGRVIVEAEGEDSKMIDFIEWCRKGPEGSKIDSFVKNDKEIIGYEDFKIL